MNAITTIVGLFGGFIVLGGLFALYIMGYQKRKEEEEAANAKAIEEATKVLNEHRTPADTAERLRKHTF